ncbi:unnamed protein product [Closterium sp. Naga37s-1]|nr:unnamed protein product [Closterium sp. Naga37s-1]
MLCLCTHFNAKYACPPSPHLTPPSPPPPPFCRLSAPTSPAAPTSPPPVSIPAHDVAPPQLAPPAASRATDATPPPALPPPPSAPSTAVGSAANSPFSLCPPSTPPCLTPWLSPSCGNGNADKAEKRETGTGETAGKVAGKGEAAEGEQELGGENRPLRLVVIGGGAAGVFGAIRAKELAPGLEVRVVEKSHPLGKVRGEGGGVWGKGGIWGRAGSVWRDSSQGDGSWFGGPSGGEDSTAGEAKEMAPGLEVRVVEKSQPLGKVRISGGGRCNVTTGLAADPIHLSSHYPRGHRELKGSFFRTHGPADTVEWFTQRGVPLKTEPDGRMFPVSDSSQSVIDCLLSQAHELSGAISVTISPGWPVASITRTPSGQFLVSSSKKTPTIINSSSSPSSSPSSSSPLSLMADFVLIATGGSIKGHDMASSLGHSIILPCPSLFTFNIPDSALTAFAGWVGWGVTLVDGSAEMFLLGYSSAQFSLPPSLPPPQPTSLPFSNPPATLVADFTPHLSAAALLPALTASSPHLCFLPPFLTPFLPPSPPPSLPLSFPLSLTPATLVADFTPHLTAAALLSALTAAKSSLQKKQIGTTAPVELNLPRRFWCYLLDRAEIHPETLWAHVSKAHLLALADGIHKAELAVAGKGRFKDEFVTAGGVPLKEVFPLISFPFCLPFFSFFPSQFPSCYPAHAFPTVFQIPTPSHCFPWCFPFHIPCHTSSSISQH